MTPTLTLEVGTRAPDFSLPDQDGTVHQLLDYRGQWVLIYFYPRDDTPGCTTEACGIRDRFDEFLDANVTVLGVSADTSAKHRKFVDKYELPFTLLADVDRTVVRQYGVWGRKKFMGREFDGIHRHSFLIDPAGKIARVYPKVKPALHAAEVLQHLGGLQS